MKRAVSLGVFVVAVLAVQMTSYAQGLVLQNSPGMPQNRVIPQNMGIPQNGVIPQTEAIPQIALFPPPGVIPQKDSLAKFAAKRTGDAKMPVGAFNGFAQIRQVPDLGAPGSSGNGFHHFSLPMDKFTNWYRPRAATLTQYQRCAPDDFRPRGFGHLFARPYDGYRMEYEPYVLSDGMSTYGPAYIARMPDPRCDDHCNHCTDDECEDDCEKCRR